MKDIRLEEATFDNVLRPMANNENNATLLKNVIVFYQYVSENKDLRDASSKAEKELEVMLQIHSPEYSIPSPGLQNLIVPFCAV